MTFSFRHAVTIAAFCVAVSAATAAERESRPAPSEKQGYKTPDDSRSAEKLATARLLGVRRIKGRKDSDQPSPPDGLGFAVLVSPTTPETGERSIKETRDFRVAGESYQEKTRAALGKNFEPQTVIHDAEKFFAATPALADGSPPPPGSFVLMMNIGGAELPAGAPVEITLHVGYKKKPDTFVLRTKVPPSR